MTNAGERPQSPRAANPSAWIPRATRLRVGAPVAYRPIFEDRWAKGATVNISRTGVLFQPAETNLSVGQEVQLVVYLSRTPAEEHGGPLAMPDLYCGGRLTRVEDPVTGGRAAVAMQIDFEWADAPPGRLWETGIEL